MQNTSQAESCANIPASMQDASWFKNSITMHVFLDRYVGCRMQDGDKPEFIGGSLEGLISKLEYLQWLGINCLWLSPFYRSSAYHGYHITDFFNVENHFGSLADIQRLSNEAHSRGIRLIADFVPNHCSYLHSFFMQAQAERNSPYRDWFSFQRWPDKYTGFMNYEQLPKLNLDNPAARAHIIEAAKYWLSWGFDGLRLDHAIGPKIEFWQAFRKAIKQDYPQAVLIGEVALFGLSLKHANTLGMKHKRRRLLFGCKEENLYQDYCGILDGVLDFVANGYFKDLVSRNIGSAELAAFAAKLKKHFSKFPKDFYLPVFLDNHDMERFLFHCAQDKEKLKRCAEILFSLEQPVILYYGTEAGMSQKQPNYALPHHGDLLARQPMPWNEIDTELQQFFKNLIWKRRESR